MTDFDLASTPAGDAHSSAASAPSSTSRAASRDIAPPTMSNASCGRMLAQGVTNFFVTDDDFARNRNWEVILDRIIALRQQEGFRPSLIFQVDTLCLPHPGFIEKAARAGCIGVFIGLQSINPELLVGAKKRQNKIGAYREMLLAWRKAGVVTCVRIYPRVSRPIRPQRSRATSTSSRKSFRSTSWSFSS